MGKKQAKQEEKQFNKITSKLTSKAADGKIGGKEIANLTARFGSGAVANAVAQMALGNPDLKIGKLVTKVAGLKVFGEGDNRYATYNPAKISMGTNFVGSFGKIQPTSANNTMTNSIYGNSWYGTASGPSRYVGPAGPVLPKAEPAPTPAPKPTPTPTTTNASTDTTAKMQIDPVSVNTATSEPIVAPSSGMMSGGGAGAAGASKLGRAKSRLRQLGINSKGAGLLGRSLQYGNALNI